MTTALSDDYNYGADLYTDPYLALTNPNQSYASKANTLKTGYGIDLTGNPSVTNQTVNNDYDDLLGLLQTWGADTATGTGNTGYSSGVSYYGQPLSPTGSMTTTTAIKPTSAMPSLTLPELALPAYNEAELTSSTQKIASPIVRSQRQLAERALSRHYENPNVAKLVSGEILRQFGTNLATSLSGARTTAANEYAQKLQLERQKVQAEHQVKYQQALTNYQAALQDYMQQYGSQSTQKYTYGTSGSSASSATMPKYQFKQRKVTA